MSPETHLLASWIIAAKTTDNARDCRLVDLGRHSAGCRRARADRRRCHRWVGGKQTQFYAQYHHYLLHGALGGILIAALMACFARHRWRVALLALLVFHLHLLCDFVGSRGPAPEDLWPIFYFGPFDKDPCGSGKDSGGWTDGSIAT